MGITSEWLHLEGSMCFRPTVYCKVQGGQTKNSLEDASKNTMYYISNRTTLRYGADSGLVLNECKWFVVNPKRVWWTRNIVTMDWLSLVLKNISTAIEITTCTMKMIRKVIVFCWGSANDCPDASLTLGYVVWLALPILLTVFPWHDRRAIRSPVRALDLFVDTFQRCTVVFIGVSVFW